MTIYKQVVFIFILCLIINLDYSLAKKEKDKSHSEKQVKQDDNDALSEYTDFNLNSIVSSQKSLVLTGRSDYLAGSISINGVPYTVVIDTTTNYLIIAKKKCEGCTQFPPYYKESPVADQIQCDSPSCHSFGGNICEKPSKLDPPTCGYATTLPNGASIRTNLVRDLISVDDFKNIPVLIAGIYEQEGSASLQQAVFGIGPSCPLCPPSPLQTILTTLKKPYIFGISLDKNFFGGMSLGKIDPLLYSGSINYTAMVRDPKLNYYSFLPSYIGSYWNGEIFHILKGNLTLFHFKTASPLSYFPSPIYNQLKNFFKNGCKNDFTICSKIENLFNSTQCVILNQQQIDQFPNIEIYFDEGFSLSLSPRIYLYSLTRDNQVYHCFGILETTSPTFTIGINLMRELYIIFDNDLSKIGFSKK
ncbi:hypothetical protein DLAC_00038 [Tieghemostelium lacteum]|uniref:Peptidase A1 domain-containing protein n=1 Tax=Tieghemostelium lacteum TaxID=361077 RepID=A0A152A8P5_TIELA|nr:hypothetical protein DLAC_00038 [Tieghemostelium lacteum]|eukprot:KYR02596.1 hypothetical protein DLAC_00038 [Tieghemostelium lacteum]